MRICKKHWALCRAAISDHGLDHLIAKDGKAAADSFVAEVKGEETPFDPLMAMNNHWFSCAIDAGGIYLMFINEQENPDNEGHYCPICEYEKHSEGFDAPAAIDSIAEQLLAYCRKNNIIPQLS